MEDIIVSSPDSLHKAVMQYAGEIRFGPTYYSLTLDKIAFAQRIFGKSYLWSPDSQYFAVQEWETTRESHSPQTRLLLIDLKLQKQCVLSRAEKGFIVPKKFEEKKLIYTKEYHGQGTIKQFEIEFLFVDRWDKLK